MPTEYGGLGFGCLESSTLSEELGYGCTGIAVALGGNGLAVEFYFYLIILKRFKVSFILIPWLFWLFFNSNRTKFNYFKIKNDELVCTGTEYVLNLAVSTFTVLYVLVVLQIYIKKLVIKFVLWKFFFKWKFWRILRILEIFREFWGKRIPESPFLIQGIFTDFRVWK